MLACRAVTIVRVKEQSRRVSQSTPLTPTRDSYERCNSDSESNPRLRLRHRHSDSDFRSDVAPFDVAHRAVRRPRCDMESIYFDNVHETLFRSSSKMFSSPTASKDSTSPLCSTSPPTPTTAAAAAASVAMAVATPTPTSRARAASAAAVPVTAAAVAAVSIVTPINNGNNGTLTGSLFNNRLCQGEPDIQS